MPAPRFVGSEVKCVEDPRLLRAAPRADALPAFELDRTVTPTPVNPLGAKGVGEAGCVGAPQAVVNAVVDALAFFGVTHVDMPLRPEKIWALCREGRAAAGRCRG